MNTHLSSLKLKEAYGKDARFQELSYYAQKYLPTQSDKIDKTISGIKIFVSEFKISQYADDTTVCVSDLESAQNLFKLLNIMHSRSALGSKFTQAKLKVCG